MIIRSVIRSDRLWIEQLLRDHWGGDCIISGGTQYFPQEMDGLIAIDGSERVGLLSFSKSGPSVEIVLLQALKKHEGIGTALIECLVKKVIREGCRLIFLYTTNDNLDALRFYQRRDFKIVSFHPESMVNARQIKPGIPEIGDYDIPIRDEFRLERLLRIEESPY